MSKKKYSRDIQAAVSEYALRLGDNSLILGQRLGEWTGHSAAVEIDMALTNIALDLIGQAQHFLGHAGELEGKGRDADALAFTRDAHEFRNLWLVEQDNGDFARTIARQFLFSTWQKLLLTELATSADETLASIAEKAVKEVSYHQSFAHDWMLRLGDGTEESHDRLQRALYDLWGFTGEMFGTDTIDDLLVAEGIGVDPALLEGAWAAEVDAVLARAGLTKPEDCCPGTGRMVTGGHRGHHSEHLGHLLSDMQFLQRAYPGLEW